MIQIQLFAHFIFIAAIFCIQSLLPVIQENISSIKRLLKLIKGGKDSSEKIIRGNTVFTCRFLTFPVTYVTLNLVYNEFDLIVAT